MIAIGSDHGGVELKEKVIKHLQARGIECEDTGCYSTESCDYPVYAKKVTDLVTSGKCELGILICGTGIGMSMAANKEDGIRAALCHDCFSAEATKQHNNANVLCMGARVIGEGLACKISMGYNGLPRGCSDDEFPWSREGDPLDNKYLYTAHSELNAILNYQGGTLQNAKMYVTLFPCNECAKAIIQAGIKTLVYDCDKYSDTASVIASKRMLNAAGVRYYKYDSTGRTVQIEL